MIIYQVTDPEFQEYGKIIEGIDVNSILNAMEKYTPVPEGIEYVAEDPVLQNLEAAKQIAVSLYGGLPVEFGWCNGHNTKLNCLEYHRNSEFNLGTEDFILLLGKEQDIHNHMLDTALVKAFRVPKGVLVEIYATTLHYAPCHTDPDKGIRMMVALPEGTNAKLPENYKMTEEDRYLTAVNKWLLPHPESDEAKSGAVVGLTGINIDIADSI